MKKGKCHNKIHLLTTLSIYVGLVLIGATPELLAQSKANENLRTPSFELSTRAELVASKLKLKKNVESGDIVSLASKGGSVFELPYLRHRVVFRDHSLISREVRFSNNQVLTSNLKPRASL